MVTLYMLQTKESKTQNDKAKAHNPTTQTTLTKENTKYDLEEENREQENDMQWNKERRPPQNDRNTNRTPYRVKTN